MQRCIYKLDNTATIEGKKAAYALQTYLIKLSESQRCLHSRELKLELSDIFLVGIRGGNWGGEKTAIRSERERTQHRF